MVTGENALNFSTRSSHAAHTRTLISDDGNGDNDNGDDDGDDIDDHDDFFAEQRSSRICNADPVRK